jgi:hypothetical protein
MERVNAYLAVMDILVNWSALIRIGNEKVMHNYRVSLIIETIYFVDIPGEIE